MPRDENAARSGGGQLPSEAIIRRLEFQLGKCQKRSEWLVQRLAELLPLGEVPLHPAIFVSCSDAADPRRDRLKKKLKEILGMPVGYKRCWLMTVGGDEVLGTVAEKAGSELQSGQLVLVSDNTAIVCVVPDAEVVHLKTVVEAVVDGAEGGVITVSAGPSKSAVGVVYSQTLKRELEEKPLEAGDKVLLFGPCIVALKERVKGKQSKVNVRKATFKDIGGLDDKIQEIKDVMGLDFSEDAKRKINMEEGRGVVLEGPPGCGKTAIVRALATELGYYLVLVNGADFEIMWVGMSQKELRRRLDEALKNKPAIIFFDEVETAFPVRGISPGMGHKNDNLAAFNTFIDGVEDTSGVFVIFGSNRLDQVDPAAIRAGRMDKRIYIPRPNRKRAPDILRIYLDRHPVGEPGKKEEIVERWIKSIIGEIFVEHPSTLLFTAYHESDSEPADYYFKNFVSGGLLKGVVNEAVLRALKRLSAAGTSVESPEFGLTTEDFEGVASCMITQEVPKDDKSRNEWLMVNGYRRALEFRDGEAVKLVKKKNANR